MTRTLQIISCRWIPRFWQASKEGDDCRRFQVSEAIDGDKISAQYADDMLTLHLAKAEALKPRKIAVAVK